MESKSMVRQKLDAIFPEILQLSRQIHVSLTMQIEVARRCSQVNDWCIHELSKREITERRN